MGRSTLRVHKSPGREHTEHARWTSGWKGQNLQPSEVTDWEGQKGAFREPQMRYILFSGWLRR